jgi:hypothetical protein
MDEEREKIVEKALKIRELANRGVGGEKETAIRMLLAYREKHTITDAEMNSFICYHSSYYDGMDKTEQSTNFNTWFKKSVAFDDEKNKPLVFFHKSRTLIPFSVFSNELGIKMYQDGSSYGFHFVHESDRKLIRHIGNSHLGYGIEFLVYLRIVNPYYIYAMLDGYSYGQEGEPYRPVTLTKQLVDDLTRKWFDSIIIQSEVGINVYVVFDSTQIKSIDNNGEFNPKDPDIYK